MRYVIIISHTETYGPQHAEWTLGRQPVVTADLISEVRRLCREGHSVLVVIHGTDPGVSPTLLAAGACVLQGMDESISTLATVLGLVLADAGGSADDAAGQGGRVPHLSEREISVLRAYTSGLTLDAVARKLGIRESTAKTYLKRVKKKYQQVGRPAYTKLDLASRAREDDQGLTVERAAPNHGDGIALKVHCSGTYPIEVALGSPTGEVGGFDQVARTGDRFEVA